jgi:hypothetical protein
MRVEESEAEEEQDPRKSRISLEQDQSIAGRS